AEELRQTRNAQLSTYVASMIVLDAVERTGLAPAFHAGHSLGEYSALTGAGVLSFADGVRLVTERGNAMQAAADHRAGTMAVVLGLDDEAVAGACEAGGGEVWVANSNAPGQVVVAGDPGAIDELKGALADLGAKRVMPIQVGGAFHTPFMAPAREQLAKAIGSADLRDAVRPVYANVDAAPHVAGAEWADLLSAQLTAPVRWRETLADMVEAGVTVFVELGPGSVLTGLAKRSAKGTRAIGVDSPAKADELVAELGGTSERRAEAEGETLYAAERLVVSPLTGVFQPNAELATGADIERGQVVGTVNGTEVRSVFAGALAGLLAMAGERVNVSQPLAWLRTATIGL
ncbi:MAG: ACP S-malonyltransferase, partial [Acidimicrobiales bacterium]